jgi:branched-subunit amino acid transport protein
MTIWVVLAAIGVGTYLLRVTMFLVAEGRGMPAALDEVLSMVAPAAMAALVAGMLFTADGHIDVVPVPELIAVAVGYVAIRLGGNVVVALAAGLPTMWVLTGLGL